MLNSISIFSQKTTAKKPSQTNTISNPKKNDLKKSSQDRKLAKNIQSSKDSTQNIYSKVQIDLFPI